LPRGYAEFSVVLIKSISPFPGRSLDHALGITFLIIGLLGAIVAKSAGWVVILVIVLAVIFYRLTFTGRLREEVGQDSPTVASQAPTPGVAVQTLPPQQPQQPSRWTAGRILLLVIVAPVLLAIAWVVFQIAVGFLNGLLGG
jgi:hypothetical protein